MMIWHVFCKIFTKFRQNKIKDIRKLSFHLVGHATYTTILSLIFKLWPSFFVLVIASNTKRKIYESQIFPLREQNTHRRSLLSTSFKLSSLMQNIYISDVKPG